MRIAHFNGEPWLTRVAPPFTVPRIFADVWGKPETPLPPAEKWLDHGGCADPGRDHLDSRGITIHHLTHQTSRRATYPSELGGCLAKGLLVFAPCREM